MRLLPFLLPLLLAAPAAPAADLLDVYRQARAGDPQLATARAALGIREEGAVQALAPALPQWSAGAALSRERPGDGTQQGVSTQLSQLLFDASRTKLIAAAEVRVQAEQALLQAAEQALCERVATAYFNALTADETLANAVANEAAFAQQVAQAGARVASGLAAQVDLAQARAYHALARGGTAAAQQAQADARAALAEVAGAPVATLRPLAAALPPAPLGAGAAADDWVLRALQGNPSLRARELALQAGDEALAAARRAHGPTVNLSLGAERLRPTGGDPRNNRTVAVALTVPLFSGGATASLARQAVYERDTAREALEAERRRVQRETRAQWQALASGLAQLETSQLSVDAAREALAATRSGQTLGTRSSTDLLLAIQTLTSAQNALAQSRQQVVLARLRLALAAGALDEPALAAVNAWLQP